MPKFKKKLINYSIWEWKEGWMRFDWVWWFRVAAVFILNFWVCFFHVDFIIFLDLWVWFVEGFSGGKGFWMNFCMCYLLRKCNKRKENIDYFNFLGNLHVLSQRTWRTCYFVLPKIMKRKERKNFNYSF